MTATFPATQFA